MAMMTDAMQCRQYRSGSAQMTIVLLLLVQAAWGR
jgi:hypothetical protein